MYQICIIFSYDNGSHMIMEEREGEKEIERDRVCNYDT